MPKYTPGNGPLGNDKHQVAGKKPDNPAVQDIRKAIDHLHFELERLINEEKKS